MIKENSSIENSYNNSNIGASEFVMQEPAEAHEELEAHESRLIDELQKLAPTGNMLAFDSLPERIQRLPKNSPEIFENLTNDRVLFWLNFLNKSASCSLNNPDLSSWLHDRDGFATAADLDRVKMLAMNYGIGSEIREKAIMLKSSLGGLADLCKAYDDPELPQAILSYFVNGRDVEELKTCLPLFFAKDETVHMDKDGDLNTLYTRYVNILPELKSEHLEAKNLALDESFKREHPVRSAIEKCCCFSLQCLRPAQYRH